MSPSAVQRRTNSLSFSLFDQQTVYLSKKPVIRPVIRQLRCLALILIEINAIGARGTISTVRVTPQVVFDGATNNPRAVRLNFPFFLFFSLSFFTLFPTISSEISKLRCSQRGIRFIPVDFSIVQLSPR